MRSWRRLLAIYPALLRTGLAEAIAYRAEFLVWMLSMTMPLIMLALMGAVTAEGPIGRFDAGTFVTYYLITLIVRQLTGSWIVWDLVREVKDGTLATRLLRPVHPLLAYSAENLAALPFRALISIPLAVILLAVSGGAGLTRDPFLIACFALSLVGALVMNFSVSAIIGSLAFFIDSAVSVWELWLGGFMMFSGYLVPLELFPAWLRSIARVLPFPLLLTLPVDLATGRLTHAAAVGELLFQGGYAALAVLGMLAVFRLGLRRFAAFGG